MYHLNEPLMPGDSVAMTFLVRYVRRGFKNQGVSQAVTRDATFFQSADFLPAIGYQTNRELTAVEARIKYSLPKRVFVLSLYDERARTSVQGRESVRFSAIIGTSSDQHAVAPGDLVQTWSVFNINLLSFLTSTFVYPRLRSSHHPGFQPSV